MFRKNIDQLDYSSGADGPGRFYDPTKNSPLALEIAETIDRDWYPELSGLSIEHSRRVTGYLQLFTENQTLDNRHVQLPEEVYDAALLHDFYDMARNDDVQGDAVRQLLVKLVDGWDESRSLKTWAFLRDMSVAEKPMKNYVKSAIHHKDDDSADYDWSTEAPLSDWDMLYEVANNVHIEALVIKGAEILDRVKNPSGNKAENLRCIFEAESCYIPILNSLGLNTLAMELASSCHIARLRGQGKNDLIDQATNLYRSVEDADPGLICQKVLGLKSVPNVKWIVNESDSDIDRGVNCRAGEILFKTKDNQPIKIEFRQKSIGSLANKINSKEGLEYNVRDLLGLKVIVGSDDINKELDQQELLVELYNSMASGLLSNENIELVQTRPGRKPFYVQGKPDFINRLESFNIGGEARNISQVEVKTIPYTGAYDVAKVTTMVHGVEGDNLPVETQFVTGVSYYWDDKMGPIAHDLRRFNKSRTDDDNIGVLGVVRSRNGVVVRRDCLGDPRGRQSSISLAREALSRLIQGNFAKNPEVH